MYVYTFVGNTCRYIVVRSGCVKWRTAVVCYSWRSEFRNCRIWIRKQFGQNFYCPNGHTLTFKGPTEFERQKRKLQDEIAEKDRKENMILFFREQSVDLRKKIATEEQRSRAYKGHMNRLKKMVKSK